jgi:hypothetical protein
VHRSGTADYGERDDWGSDGGQQGFAVSGESLEPLPSSDGHYGSAGRDDRSRRRWPAPDDDDRDNRDDRDGRGSW